MTIKETKTILVVGGAGFIGSHVNKLLHQVGYSTVILDNLSTGSVQAVQEGTFVKGDLSDKAILKKVFTTFPIQGVIHFAASTDVGESMENPSLYYRNNVMNTLNLLDAMVEHLTVPLVFSSSAAIFGNPTTELINEEHLKKPVNPYGKSKLMVEEILKDYERAYNLRSISLRYFNAAGGDPDGKLPNTRKHETNLIPAALRSLLVPGDQFTLFGTNHNTPDGTCIRDFIHVMDLARAHILAIERLFQGAPTTAYNLGNGHGFSVREVLAVVEAVSGSKLKIKEAPRRPGDPPILVADSTRAIKELKWHPQYPELETIVSDAYQALAHMIPT